MVKPTDVLPFADTVGVRQMPLASIRAPLGLADATVALTVALGSCVHIANMKFCPLLYFAVQIPRASRLADIGVYAFKKISNDRHCT